MARSRRGTIACRTLLTLAATGLCLASAGEAGQTDTKALLPQVKEFSLQDVSGNRHSPAEWAGRKAVVLVFLATECPVSNSYAPVLKRLAAEYQPKGVAVYGVHADPELSAAAAIKHAAEYGLSFPLLLDPQQVLARQTGATRVPEAVLVSPQGQVLYRGRIDDRYAPDGRRRDEPRVHDLKEAIVAVLAGKAPARDRTPVYGCPLPPPAPLPP
jgi:peroxiredoxin